MHDTIIIVPGKGGKGGIKAVAGALKVYEENKEKKTLIVFSGYDYEKDKKLKFLAENVKKRCNAIIEKNSRSTYENALNSYSIIKRENPKEIFVVLDSIHYGRAKRIFEKMYKDNLKFEVVSYFSTKEFLYELIAYLSIPFQKFLFENLIKFRSKTFQKY